MPDKQGGKELFIVDNSDDDWKVRNYLGEWCELSKSFDIATGYFEIGALLNLDGKWQGLEKIRILMGDEVSKRTMKAFQEAIYSITSKLDGSLEEEKRMNDFLDGVPAIVQAIKSGKIECRVYKKKKFHAKAYITHSKFEVVGSAALVGSSNFTEPGLNQNVELNIQVRSKVEELQEWFERHWNDAEDVTPDVLQTIEKHTRDFIPFEIYVKSLYEYFKGHELSESEWELKHSKVYPILDQYQKEGYQALMKIASKYNGAFLCDGVGLGKTFIGLMLIERLLLKENKRVVLIVPKSARKPVWEAKLRKHVPDIMKGSSGLMPFKIINHTDLLRQPGGDNDWPGIMDSIRDQADVIIIDESHHFRNRNSSYEKIFELAKGKQMFLLTATPINNTLLDLLHQIELFTREDPEYFAEAPLGIHSLRGHFIVLEKAIQASLSAEKKEDRGIGVNEEDARELLANDELLKALVVQRSRSYVKESQKATGKEEVQFPVREDPVVIDYSLKKVYGKVLDRLVETFDGDEPLLTLAMYYPLANYRGEDGSIDPMMEGRQEQVVGLIRTLLLKRFESSKEAFESSCELLLLKLIAFVKLHAPDQGERWERQNKAILEYVDQDLKGRWAPETEEESEDDYFLKEAIGKTERLSDKEYDVQKIVQETILDMTQLTKIIQDLVHIKGREDDKIKQLASQLGKPEILKNHKILIFTEYMDTARYILSSLKADKRFRDVVIEEIDGSTSTDRGEIIRRFSPYYNDSSSGQLKEEGHEEIQILISTDVLSEGLNLQDATLLINYDLHWNPVRLMQRIGRIDRRFDKEVERRIIQDHPHLKKMRGKVHLWNFLPPDELDNLLELYKIVTKKTLRISKTFGIEGKKLFTPDDDYEALKEFNQGYEGETTLLEKMHLEYQKIAEEHPDIVELIRNLPSKAFSGKASGQDVKGVFFCYNLPGPDAKGNWTEEAGQAKWYLHTMGKDAKIIDNETEIIKFIRCELKTARKAVLDRDTLVTMRIKMDDHVKNTYLKSVQAPGGVTVTLKAWMELN